MGIGGSEIASVLNLPGSFKSAYILWLEKAGYKEPDRTQKPIFEWGHRLEPTLAEKFADMHPEWACIEGGSWVNKDRPFHLANPDRLLRDTDGSITSVLEIKTSKTGFGWDDRKAPLKYIAQLRWYLDAFGFDFGYLNVLIGMEDYREYLVPRNPMMPVVDLETGEEQFYDVGGHRSRDAATEFMASIPRNEPPEIDGHSDIVDYLRSKNMSIVTKGEGSEVVLSDEVGDLVAESRELQARADKLTDKAKGHLLAHMGTAKSAKHGDRVIATRTSRGKDGVPYIVFK